jgi:hypothetical protein
MKKLLTKIFGKENRAGIHRPLENPAHAICKPLKMTATMKRRALKIKRS